MFAFLVRGPRGAKGETGDAGAQGEQGIQGIQGNAGPAFASRCLVRLNSNQTIPTGELTVVEFDTAVYDGLTEWGSNKFTAQAAGYYTFNCSIYVPTPSDAHWMFCRVNNTAGIVALAKIVNTVTATYAVMVCGNSVYLGIGDWLRVTVEHNKGSNQDIQGAASFYTFFSVRREA